MRAIDLELDWIERQYNPEHDSGANIGAPPVTHVEMRLLQAIRVLTSKAEELEERLEQLEGQNE